MFTAPGYVSPFADADGRAEVDCSRHDRMLRKVERDTRTRLEAVGVTLRVAKWVAGGGTREGRARRADVALYAQTLVRGEGWPEVWVLDFLGKLDAAKVTERRAHGLRVPGVERTCEGHVLPSAAPAPRRRTKRGRQREALAAALRDLAARVEEVEAPRVKRSTV